VTLEGPSWIGAMLALENTMTDKVAFCAEYGITVTEADWPSRHASRAIMGDRGELELEYATSLVDGLDREVSNTAPFRADWKGTVERDFRTIDDEGVHWVPGAVRGYRKRGGPDYRLDACLNLQEFRQLMIHLILHHNRFHELKNYNRSEAMIKDHVDAYPIDLWNWGIENCVGQLRALDRDIVRWNLLPHGEASVTGEGIKFKGRTYDCKLAHDKGWYAMARASGWFPRDVSYDPRKPEVIYLRGEDGGRLVTCHMVEGEKAFWGKDWYDILELNELELQREPEKRTRHQQAQAELNAARKSLTDPAFEEAKDARQGMSKAAQVRGIRDNRALEVEKEHEDGAWTFADGERDGESGEGNEAQDMGFRYVAAPKKTDLMRDLDRELLE
jgi:putative transposase